MKIIESKQETLRKRVYTFIDLHPKASTKTIVKHFLDEAIPRSTIYRIAKRKMNKLSIERKSGSGRPAKKMTKKEINILKKTIDHKDGVSQRGLARRFKISQSYVCRIINGKTSIRYRKKKKTPRRTPAQKAVVRSKCRKLVSLFRKKCVIIDDESYFGLSNQELSTNAGFYSSDLNKTENEVKLKRKDKFEPKLMVWLAFSEKGISQHYIVPSRQAVTENVYISKCLSKLESFIQKVHENDDIVFWPDLATSHYSYKVQDHLRSKNIEFVPKLHNPANVPELRPIEDFWSELKRLVYASNKKYKNLNQLKTRIEYIIKKIDPCRVHRLAKCTFTRIDRVRRHGMKNL